MVIKIVNIPLTPIYTIVIFQVVSALQGIITYSTEDCVIEDCSPAKSKGKEEKLETDNLKWNKMLSFVNCTFLYIITESFM